MRVTETELMGVVLLEPDEHQDERGSFARVWDRELIEARGFDGRVEQCSVSYNRRRGTLRGIHYQAAPFAEQKLVRCTRGAIYDVILDIRDGSNTFGRWISVELSAENHRSVLIAPGLAHGFQTLENDSEVYYQMATGYRPDAARGIRFDDPRFGVSWPIADKVMSQRDRTFADFQELT